MKTTNNNSSDTVLTMEGQVILAGLENQEARQDYINYLIEKGYNYTFNTDEFFGVYNHISAGHLEKEYKDAVTYAKVFESNHDFDTEVVPLVKLIK